MESENVSRNLVYNFNAMHGLDGWSKFLGSWRLESSDLRFHDHFTKNFVSSHYWCGMAQAIDLTRYLKRPDLAGVTTRMAIANSSQTADADSIPNNVDRSDGSTAHYGCIRNPTGSMFGYTILVVLAAQC